MSPLATNAELNRDPTRSITLRRKYAADAYKRFQHLKGLIRQTIIDNDAFRLTNSPGLSLQQAASDFGFGTDAQKLEAFIRWLQEQIDSGILEISPGRALPSNLTGHWQSSYVRSAYGKGIEQATSELRKQGVEVPRKFEQTVTQTFRQPIHANKLETLFTRNFQELKGITAAMDQQISRTLTEGLSQGLNPREIARNLNGRVDAIGINRARTMARTEVVRAHAESTLTRYEQAGVDAVEGKAEFATAGDNRVCPICIGLEGEVMKIEEARGTIPVHANCRCTWIPVVNLGARNVGVTRGG